MAALAWMLGLLLTVTAAQAQNAAQTIAGKVVDAKGEPLIGVTVMVEGSNSGTQTDLQGAFSLPANPANGVLVVSFIGFKTQKVPLKGRTTLTITLQEDVASL
jgi:uncharacterized protein YfaP (DUF2135 family)